MSENSKDFKAYIKAVGTGPKGNRDLSFYESKDMMEQILSATPRPEQIAAFLLGWRLKGETIEEFKGALCAMDALMQKTEIANSIELGYPFDGKAKNPYILKEIAHYLKATPLQLVVTGDELQPAKAGVTTKEYCGSFEATNLHFFDRASYLKELHELTELRMLLGVRTGLNTIEKLSGVAASKSAITGVHHTPYVRKYIEIYASRYERFALIQGDEGGIELFKKGKLWLHSKGQMQEYLLDPLAFGVEGSEDLEGLARLNAAILLFVSGEKKSVEEAYESLFEASLAK